jgi:hypothetical protein
MKCYSYLVIIFLLVGFIHTESFAQEKKLTPEEEYAKVITERSDKIVNSMSFDDESLKTKVRDIIVEHYRFLNDAEEARNADVAKIREEYANNKELRDAKIDLRKAEMELNVRDHHFAFVSVLKQLIPENQIDEIKDGLTYGVLMVTYNSYCDMIPSLTEEEKAQIQVWLTEAREHAIDGGSSKEKHAWFGKYKGRINNYLSARGHDLQAERKAWEARLENQRN